MKHKDKAIMLSVLKELQKGKHPCSMDYGIAPEEFIGIVSELANRGYISGLYLMDMSRGDDPLLLRQARVTPEGDDFLSENSKLMKAYFEFKDWISIVASILSTAKQ
ncbi:MAG: hypothetical protein ILP16_08375 [Spirochaetales bacterium]|nr:hypothetical protein [Spirochaetales bacterium]